MKFSTNIYITTSKIVALIILIIGSIFAFIYKDSEVIIFTFSLASGLIGLKTWSEGLTNRKKIDRETYYERPYEDEV